MAAPQRLARDERRARILEAAARVFAERGYERAAMDEIAERAGITKPIVYRHFGSKRDLYLSLIELHSGDLMSFMTERIAAAAEPASQVAAGFDAFFEFAETHLDAWKVLFRDPAPVDPVIVEAHRTALSRASAMIAALVEAAPVTERPDYPIDRALGATLVGEATRSAAIGLASWWYDNREVTREQLVTVAMNTVWVGLERFGRGERWMAGPPG